MKTIPTLLCIAAIAAVFYHGSSINHATETLTQQLDRALAESAKWQAEADRLNNIIDHLPATARATAEEAAKGGTRQLTKELVALPSEVPKIIAKNTAATGKKAYKDTVNEVERAPKNVSKAIGRATGLW